MNALAYLRAKKKEVVAPTLPMTELLLVELDALIDNKKRLVAELIDNKVDLGDGWFYTRVWEQDYINNPKMNIWLYYNNVTNKTVAVRPGKVVVKLKSGALKTVFLDGVLNLTGITYFFGKGRAGKGNYIALNIRYARGQEGRSLIRQHVIVVALTKGYVALDSFEADRVNEIHHKNWNRWDNDPDNLVSIPKGLHDSLLPKEPWTDFLDRVGLTEGDFN